MESNGDIKHVTSAEVVPSVPEEDENEDTNNNDSSSDSSDSDSDEESGSGPDSDAARNFLRDFNRARDRLAKRIVRKAKYNKDISLPRNIPIADIEDEMVRQFLSKNPNGNGPEFMIWANMNDIVSAVTGNYSDNFDNF